MAFLVFFALPLFVSAQSSLTLSVTPTLFEMSANPGQIWQSNVKVINSNEFDITVYASVVNFAPQGEAGQGTFLPVFENMTEGSTLAEWVDVSSKPITIQRERSETIPFTVTVPDDASPGGHFAAILISTQPTETHTTAVKTAQVVTSLFFVRIAGDVIEKGSIRSFSAAESFLQTPEATLELRFENKGNVHLQPRGEIVISNMWGKERGKIPINHQTHFGNVLPDSIRKFEFSWKGEQSISDIGRYKAVASLAYGFNEKKFTTQSTYFWVVPIKSLLITLGSVFALIFVISWAIKLYIRRMLSLAGVPTERVYTERESRHVQKHERTDGDIQISAYHSITGPMRFGIHDLKERLSGAHVFLEKVHAVIGFIFVYKIFFSVLFMISISVVGTVFFFADVTDNTKSYEVTISNPDAQLSLNSEEIAYNERVETANLTPLGTLLDQEYDIIVTNTSGKSGTAAKTAIFLAEKGYSITKLTSDDTRVDTRTVIVYDSALQEEALMLSKTLSGALLSARTATSTAERDNITIFTGKDQLTR